MAEAGMFKMTIDVKQELNIEATEEKKRPVQKERSGTFRTGNDTEKNKRPDGQANCRSDAASVPKPAPLGNRRPRLPSGGRLHRR